jgi:hypothetical protein
VAADVAALEKADSGDILVYGSAMLASAPDLQVATPV